MLEDSRIDGSGKDRKMKRVKPAYICMTLSSLVMSLTLVLTPPAAAYNYTYTVTTVNGYGPYQTGVGGEFSLQTNANLRWVLGNYVSGMSSNISSNNSFQSFCIEANEYIYPSTTHGATIGSASVFGGVAGGVNPGTQTGRDPISVGTALLYYQFAKGTLSGYDYSAGTGRLGSARNLQNTIWWLEGEAGDPGTGNLFRNYVIAQFGSNVEAMKDNNGRYPVMALNLWNINGEAFDFASRRQDQLVVVPVPAAVWLFGTGIIGLAAMRRRMRN